MGMFSVAQKRAPNATLLVITYKSSEKLCHDHCDDDAQEKHIQFAIPFARKLRSKRLKRHIKMRLELIKRENRKLGQKEPSQRKNLKRK